MKVRKRNSPEATEVDQVTAEVEPDFDADAVVVTFGEHQLVLSPSDAVGLADELQDAVAELEDPEVEEEEEDDEEESEEEEEEDED